jgi:hypothetical protein
MNTLSQPSTFVRFTSFAYLPFAFYNFYLLFTRFDIFWLKSYRIYFYLRPRMDKCMHLSRIFLPNVIINLIVIALGIKGRRRRVCSLKPLWWMSIRVNPENQSHYFYLLESCKSRKSYVEKLNAICRRLRALRWAVRVFPVRFRWGVCVVKPPFFRRGRQIVDLELRIHASIGVLRILKQYVERRLICLIRRLSNGLQRFCQARQTSKSASFLCASEFTEAPSAVSQILFVRFVFLVIGVPIFLSSSKYCIKHKKGEVKPRLFYCIKL